MDFLNVKNGIFFVLLAFLLGLFGFTVGCNVDGDRWNYAMREAWQSLGIQSHAVPTDSGVYLYFGNDTAGVVEDEPVGDTTPAPE